MLKKEKPQARSTASHRACRPPPVAELLLECSLFRSDEDHAQREREDRDDGEAGNAEEVQGKRQQLLSGSQEVERHACPPLDAQLTLRGGSSYPHLHSK